MTGPIDRPAYNIQRLTERLISAGWKSVEVVDSTGSTNTDLTAKAASLPDMSVLLAEEQTAGRGRLGRPWVAPRHSQVTFSVLVRPQVPVAAIGLLPVLTGLAVTDALRELGANARVKWPNDVLIEGKKMCGILAEAHSLQPHPTIIVGAGINVSLTESELPIRGATSLMLEGIDVSREDVTVAVLTKFGEWYSRWVDAKGDGSSFLPAYRPLSATIGEQVRAELIGRPPLVGQAVDITDNGELLIRDRSGQIHTVAAGDVVHARLEALYGDPYAEKTADGEAQDSKAPGEFKSAKAPGEFKGSKAPGEFKGPDAGDSKA